MRYTLKLSYEELDELMALTCPDDGAPVEEVIIEVGDEIVREGPAAWPAPGIVRALFWCFGPVRPVDLPRWQEARAERAAAQAGRG